MVGCNLNYEKLLGCEHSIKRIWMPKVNSNFEFESGLSDRNLHNIRGFCDFFTWIRLIRVMIGRSKSKLKFLVSWGDLNLHKNGYGFDFFFFFFYFWRIICYFLVSGGRAKFPKTLAQFREYEEMKNLLFTYLLYRMYNKFWVYIN